MSLQHTMYRNIHWHNIVGKQRPVVWDAMAHHIVDAGANALRETSVPKRGRVAVKWEGNLMGKFV